MTTVKGWDTKGITGMGLLRDGRARLEFTGIEGDVRNIFVPGASIAPTTLNLMSIGSKYDELQSGGIGSEIPSTHLLTIGSSQVGSDDGGENFVIVLKTKDGLAVRFLANQTTIQLLAAGLFETLHRHGKLPELPRFEGQQH